MFSVFLDYFYTILYILICNGTLRMVIKVDDKYVFQATISLLL